MAVMAPREHWLLGHRRHTSTSSIGAIPEHLGVVGCLGAMPEPNPSPTGSGSILLQGYRPLAYGMRLAQVREPCRGDCRDGGSEAGDDPHCDSRKPSLDDIWLWKPRVPCGETNPINKYSGSPARTTNTGHRLVIGSLRVSGVGNLQVMFWPKGIQMYCLVERL